MTSLLVAAAASLMVSATSPSSSSIPLGAQRVPMQTLTLEASCDADVAVSSLTVTHSGLGASADIERVYAMEGVRRVSRTATLTNVPAKATLRMGSFVIPKCGKRTVTVVADFSPDASAQSEHRVGILSPADIDANGAAVSGSVGTDKGSARVAPVPQGTIEVEYLPALTSTTYGAGRTLLRMRLTARDEDQLVYSVTLTNQGKARDNDLRNLSLNTRDGKLTDAAASMTGDAVTLTFDPPLRLDRGEDILMLLKGDVRASRKRTIDFEVEEPGDITAGRATGSRTSP